MKNDERNSLSADQNDLLNDKPTSNEKPTLIADKPDLTKFHKRRARDEDLIKTAKALLIRGAKPGLVALMLRLPVEKVKELFENGWNPVCRRVANSNTYTAQRLVLQQFYEGESLSDICKALGLPLFSVITALRKNGVAESAINARLPPAGDPLMVEYLRVVARKSASKFNPVKMYSNRKLHPSTVAAVSQRIGQSVASTNTA